MQLSLDTFAVSPPLSSIRTAKLWANILYAHIDIGYSQYVESYLVE
jgi:hypothetical protein